MDTAAIERKRNRLSRAYQLESEYWRMRTGYMSGQELPSKLRYAAKLLEYQFLPHYFGESPGWRKLLRQLDGQRTLPDFCVIGAIKSGTSDLAVNILLHPNIMVPLAKEFYRPDPEEWRIFYPTKRQKKDHAARYGFALSPFLAPYLHKMDVTYRLSQVQPNTKIVLTLRDPVKRVYSQWKWEVFLSGNKHAAELPFLSSFSTYVDRALSVFPGYPMYTATGFDPLQTSIYWKAVSYWMECFGRDNVLVLDVADYFFDSNRFLNQIYEFVGLPSFESPVFTNKINENPIVLPPPDEESMSKLNEFFKPYNEKLWLLLGKEFDWS
ncbi:sulfotransferase domain-containing protein [Methylomicrobium sp. RS1]|jgi:hypothetical protein|uniref:sulfotransferase domain-containing protein n=1 Tax=Candidatus Methylomicrobium oryzae TaxID=2802053 RepID=UPI001922D752|nr:sulfotransferase domain-containing protein [Methylomicrobium sp. RS1]MBL1264297.1 sulfotransferase domain-containing protein [Methylomicrobium sp. RS1]